MESILIKISYLAMFDTQSLRISSLFLLSKFLIFKMLFVNTDMCIDKIHPKQVE